MVLHYPVLILLVVTRLNVGSEFSKNISTVDTNLVFSEQNSDLLVPKNFSRYLL